MVKFKRVGNKVEFICETLEEKRVIRHALTIKHPNAYFIKQSNKNMKEWDGFVRFFPKNFDSFPYGLVDRVTSFLKEEGITEIKRYNFIKDAFVPTLQYHESLFVHQREALQKWFRYKHGIIKIPTRGGKTYMAAEAMFLVMNDIPEAHCLFVVDTDDLFLQATKDLKDYFKIRGKNIKVGQIKEGVIDVQPVTVASIMSVQSILAGGKAVKNNAKGKRTPEELRIKKRERNVLKRDLEKYLNTVTFQIVDECHEHSSHDRLVVHKKCRNATFKMFISATPFKSEDELANMNLQEVSGPVIFEVKESLLKERGVLAKDKILLISMDHNDNKNIKITSKSAYKDYEDQIIVDNEQRNHVMVNVIEICRKLRLKTLVLFVYKKHGNYIQGITGDVFLSGDDNVKYRTETKQTFLRRKGDVLLASNIFKKGVTLPEVQILLNAGGGLEQGLIIQKKGRILGVKGLKTKALTIDFIDDYTYFNEHSLSRIQVYEESVGRDGIVILDASDRDFYRDTRDFLKEWFEI